MVYRNEKDKIFRTYGRGKREHIYFRKKSFEGFWRNFLKE